MKADNQDEIESCCEYPDDHSVALYLEVESSQVVMLQAYFELLEGLAVVRTIIRRHRRIDNNDLWLSTANNPPGSRSSSDPLSSGPLSSSVIALLTPKSQLAECAQALKSINASIKFQLLDPKSNNLSGTVATGLVS